MKRNSLVVIALAALSSMAAACASTSTTESAPKVAGGCAQESLDAYCARTHCPSFDDAAAFARKPQPAGTMMRFQIGTCGEYNFIQLQEGMGMGTDYYDASGKLVASTSVADAPMCGGNEFSAVQGVEPKCERKVLESGDWSQSS